MVLRVNLIEFAKINYFLQFLLKMPVPWSRSASASVAQGFLGVLGGPFGKKPENALQNHKTTIFNEKWVK